MMLAAQPLNDAPVPHPQEPEDGIKFDTFLGPGVR